MAKKMLASYLRGAGFSRGGCRKCGIFLHFPFTVSSPIITAGFFFVPVLPTSIKETISGKKTPISLSLSMLFGASLLVIAVSCFLACLFFLFDIFNDLGKNIMRPYDFSAGLCPPGRQWSFICGEFVTRKRFR